MDQFTSQQVKLIIDSYSRELVASVLDLLELSGSSDRLINAVRQAIYDKRDVSYQKFNIITKGNAHENYKTTNKTTVQITN